jgi:hypothetical protein
VSTPREERPKPFWRSVGYLLFTLAWALVLGLTTAAFWFAVSRVAQGAVGPFHGTPIAGVVILVILGAPLIGYLFFLSPLLTATQVALGVLLLRDSLGSKDADPPVAVNTGHRIPILAPARPTELTRRLVAVGDRARVPGGPLLALVFALGAASIALVFVVGWN